MEVIKKDLEEIVDHSSRMYDYEVDEDFKEELVGVLKWVFEKHPQYTFPERLKSIIIPGKGLKIQYPVNFLLDAAFMYSTIMGKASLDDEGSYVESVKDLPKFKSSGATGNITRIIIRIAGYRAYGTEKRGREKLPSYTDFFNMIAKHPKIFERYGKIRYKTHVLKRNSSEENDSDVETGLASDEHGFIEIVDGEKFRWPISRCASLTKKRGLRVYFPNYEPAVLAFFMQQIQAAGEKGNFDPKLNIAARRSSSFDQSQGSITLANTATTVYLINKTQGYLPEFIQRVVSGS